MSEIRGALAIECTAFVQLVGEDNAVELRPDYACIKIPGDPILFRFSTRGGCGSIFYNIFKSRPLKRHIFLLNPIVISPRSLPRKVSRNQQETSKEECAQI